MLMNMMQTTPAPQDLLTLQWIIITVLASAVAYLYRQLRKCDQRTQDVQAEMLEKVLAGLLDTKEVIQGLASALEAYQDQLAIWKELERLRSELRHESKK